jgi:hypothetical protein
MFPNDKTIIDKIKTKKKNTKIEKENIKSKG